MSPSWNGFNFGDNQALRLDSSIRSNKVLNSAVSFAWDMRDIRRVHTNEGIAANASVRNSSPAVHTSGLQIWTKKMLAKSYKPFYIILCSTWLRKTNPAKLRVQLANGAWWGFELWVFASHFISLPAQAASKRGINISVPAKGPRKCSRVLTRSWSSAGSVGTESNHVLPATVCCSCEM